MKSILRSGFLALAIMALVVPASAGPLEDGLAAYNRGDYATALKFWRPHAEQGDADVQHPYTHHRLMSATRRSMKRWWITSALLPRLRPIYIQKSFGHLQGRRVAGLRPYRIGCSVLEPSLPPLL